jgi:hypothetical protein
MAFMEMYGDKTSFKNVLFHFKRPRGILIWSLKQIMAKTMQQIVHIGN